jgi:hypothetical protein
MRVAGPWQVFMAGFAVDQEDQESKKKNKDDHNKTTRVSPSKGKHTQQPTTT